MLGFIYVMLYVTSRFYLGSILGTLRSLQIAIEVVGFFAAVVWDRIITIFYIGI